MIRLLVQGASGRLGQVVVRLAVTTKKFQISEIRRGESLDRLEQVDVALDVSEAAGSLLLARRAAALRKPVVIGSTGHDRPQITELESLARGIAIVLAPNFSVGVNLLFWLSKNAARILGSGFDLEILELHHRHKKDAPSGTARRLAEILAETREIDLEPNERHGRVGQTGERLANEIGLHAIRGGDVVGEHTVYFLGSGERLELSHKASSRETFAHGALRATEWVLSQPPGLYTMEDVLGLGQRRAGTRL